MLEIRFENSTLCISVLFLVGVVAMLTLDGSGVGVLCLLFSCLHECGHLCAFAALHSIPSRIVIGLGGMRIEHTAVNLTYRQNLIVSLAGPAVNVVVALVCVAARQWTAMWVSALLGAMQLLPIRSLDGGQALLCLLSLRCSHERAGRITRIVSCVAMATLTGVALWLAVFYRNLWLLITICYVFIGFFSNIR